MMEELEGLTTQLPNEETQQLDRLSVREIVPRDVLDGLGHSRRVGTMISQ
ncbi:MULTISPECIES: hypothetical protein [Bacillales]|jgi:hypothetical protein|nr:MULTISPECIES: hypothetical protein [Bacillales]UFJ59785.1 hypothetical protein IRT44_10615 [Anoxybacillus sediminis]